MMYTKWIRGESIGQESSVGLLEVHFSGGGVKLLRHRSLWHPGLGLFAGGGGI